jgi:hypothetical protein
MTPAGGHLALCSKNTDTQRFGATVRKLYDRLPELNGLYEKGRR